MLTATDKAVWFSRIVRWGLGLVFTAVGIKYLHDDGWPVLVFGIIIFITGFFRPRRCVDDNCNL